jgi:hypothetical protein
MFRLCPIGSVSGSQIARISGGSHDLPGTGITVNVYASSTAIASVRPGGKNTSTLNRKLSGDASHQDIHAIDLHDAFGGLPEKRCL